ncbi:MAG: 4Fe-4S binding protein [Syntrophobacterales bacterium]|nr:4Fe-4S binding protein [Syntrophobacterales bacterium]
MKKSEQARKKDLPKPRRARAKAPAPAETAKAPAPKRFAIDIYRAWCKECGLCAEFCPTGCLKLDDSGRPVVADAAACSGCRFCELHCPDFAISVRECDEHPPAAGEE